MNPNTAEILTFISGISGHELKPETPLLDEGLIDSFNILEILAFLEDRFELRIDPRQVTPGEFATVDSIAQMITRLTETRTDGS